MNNSNKKILIPGAKDDLVSLIIQNLQSIGNSINECLVYCYNNMKNYKKCNSVHDYHTRTSDIIYPRHKLVKSEHHPEYAAIRYYNRLPENLKTCNNLGVFKKSIKLMLVNLEPYSVGDYLIS